MELNIEETQALLHRAGFHLSPDILFDALIAHFIESANYDIVDINFTLATFNLPLI